MRFPTLLPTMALVLLGSTIARSAVATTPPASAITKGPWVQRVSASSAVIRVEVDPPAAAALEYGDGDGGVRSLRSADAKAVHSIELHDLRAGTRYAYTVQSGGTSKAATFTTAPPDDSAEPFHFLVYGDNRTNDTEHASVVRAMTSMPSDFLVHTGDFVGSGGSASDWQKFFDIESPLLAARCLYSCVGNHELTDGAGSQYAKYFGGTDPPRRAALPELLDGTFRWGNTRFFLLNGMVGYRSGADREWVEKSLAAADHEAGLVWRIVVVHHGPWSSGPHGNNTKLHDAGIVGMFRTHDIDLVLSGHDHIYERGNADGMPYLVTGGGGAPIYEVKKLLPSARKVESVLHFVEAESTPTEIRFSAIRSDGSILEKCALVKGAGWACDHDPVAAKAAPAGAATAPASAPSSKCGCRVTGAGSSGWFGWFALDLAGLAALIARRRRSRSV